MCESVKNSKLQNGQAKEQIQHQLNWHQDYVMLLSYWMSYLLTFYQLSALSASVLPWSLNAEYRKSLHEDPLRIGGTRPLQAGALTDTQPQQGQSTEGT